MGLRLKRNGIPSRTAPPRARWRTACLAVGAVGAVSAALYAAMARSAAFADWFNGTVGAFFRTLLAGLTSWIPFSVGECLLLALPPALVLLLLRAVRRGGWRSALSFLGVVLSAAVTLFSLFVLDFAAGYRGAALDEKLGLEREKVRPEELYGTAVWLVENLNRETAEIRFEPGASSVMPFTKAAMNRKLNEAYAQFCQDRGFLTPMRSRVKPVLMSEALSYLHITGVYSFFTGEANLNVNFPDYTLPYTAAHEMAHQRGVAREDEANFIAFLVCVGSDDPYIRYSGYLNVYEYVAGALRRADRTLYLKAAARLNPEVKGETAAYGRFFAKYQKSAAGKVASVVNDGYLQSQGTVGAASYGMVVDLAVAYHRSLSP